MADYNGIEPLLGTVEGMECLVNNVGHDDDNVAVAGVDWFEIGGQVASSLFASGNSAILFGDTESIKLNVFNRNGKMWYLYRQEGTIYNSIKFLKVVWQGFTTYNSTSESNALKYEFFLFNDGRMFLNIVQSPISTGTLGTSNLTVNGSLYSFTPGTNETNPTYFTFTPDETAWSITKELIDIIQPNNKFLIGVPGKFYTVQDDELVEVSENAISDNPDDWEQGTFNGNVNLFKASNNRVRYVSPVSGTENTTYYVGGDSHSQFNLNIYSVRADGTFSAETGWKSLPFTFVSGVGTVGFCAIARLSNNAAATPADIFKDGTKVYMMPYTPDEENHSALVQLFIKYGMDRVPPSDALVTISNPDVWAWSDEGKLLTHADVEGFPPAQVVSADVDVSDPSIVGFKLLAANYSGQVNVSYSADAGTTWSTQQALSDFILTDKDALFASISDSKHLLLMFYIIADAVLTDFKITFKN